MTGSVALLRIAEADPLPGCRLRLRLTDGSTIERDVSPLLVGPVDASFPGRGEWEARTGRLRARG